MSGYLVKRLFGALPVLFGVSVVIFLLMQLAPGDVTTALLGPQATQAAKAELRHALGLDQPLPVQYVEMAARALPGDFGMSIATQLPVADLVLPRFANTDRSDGRQPAARHRDRLRRRRSSRRCARVSIVRPRRHVDDLLGRQHPALLARPDPRPAFRAQLRWLPVSGMHDMAGDGGLLDLLRHLVLPAVTTALAPAAIITRMVRSSVCEALGQDSCARGPREGHPARALCGATYPERAAADRHHHRPATRLSARRRACSRRWSSPGRASARCSTTSITARDLPVVQATTAADRAHLRSGQYRGRSAQRDPRSAAERGMSDDCDRGPRRPSRAGRPAPPASATGAATGGLRAFPRDRAAVVAALSSPRRRAGGHSSRPGSARHDPYDADNSLRYAPPGTPGHLLGTDQQGRDMLARLLWGGRVSLLVGSRADAARRGDRTCPRHGRRLRPRLVDQIDHARASTWSSPFPLVLLAIAIAGDAAPGRGDRNPRDHDRSRSPISPGLRAPRTAASWPMPFIEAARAARRLAADDHSRATCCRTSFRRSSSTRRR